LGCRVRPQAEAGGPTAPPPGSKDVKSLSTWTLNQVQTPGSLFADSDGTAWAASDEGRLVRLSSGGKAVSQSLKATFRGKTDEAKVLFACPGTGSELWLIVEDDSLTNHLAKWTPGAAEVELVQLPKEPRKLAWVPAQSALWYTATDTTLNIMARGESRPADDERYSDVAASADGRHVAGIRTPSHDVFVREISADGAAAEWRKVGGEIEGDLVGFGAGGELVVLAVGICKKGAEPTDSTLLALHPDGRREELAKGKFITATLHDNRLLVVRLAERGLNVELSRLR